MQICKNDIVEVNIESLGYRGEGVARIERIPIFINGALLGEKVRAVIIFVKKDYAIGKLLEILIPSIERVQPECKYFGKCGGCNLQHLDYSCQLEYKKDQIKDSFRKIAQIDIGDIPIEKSKNIYGYRNKGSFPVRKVNGETKIGFYAYNTHRVVEIDSCPLQSPKINELIPKLHKLMNYFEPYDEEKNIGEIKHFMVRDLGDKISLTVVSRNNILKKLKNVLESFESLASEVWLNINDNNNNVILSDKTLFVFGERIKANVFGFNMYVHPNAFLQVNENVATKLYRYALDIIKEKACDIIIDGYCGCGILTAMLSKEANRIIGIEIEPDAVENAKELHNYLGINNSSFICGDCAKIIPKIIKSELSSMIVLDPPRTGCDELMIKTINESNIENVLYISCDPATLARDILRLDNYVVENMHAFDMFPQTKHVESIVLLQKK